MIPIKLQKMIDGFQKVSFRDDPVIRRGDIRSVSCELSDEVRIAVVLAVDYITSAAQITLVHPYIELATEHDVVFPVSDTNLPYDVAIETDIIGTVWCEQLGKLAGIIRPQFLDHAYELAVDGDESISTSIYRGHPLIGPLDARWGFKVDEGMELNAISADCTNAFINDLVKLIIGSADVLAAVLEVGPDQERMFYALLEILSQRNLRATIGIEVWVAIDELGLLNPESFTGISNSYSEQLRSLLSKHYDYAIATDASNSLQENSESNFHHVNITDATLRTFETV